MRLDPTLRCAIALSALTVLGACAAFAPGTGTGASGEPAFRVRSDFTAALNSDQGWAGALNENATVNADRPFRVRFELEADRGPGRYRLQYRRNGGEWIDLEAHDFPHPEREIDVTFADLDPDVAAGGWTVVGGSASDLVVAMDGAERFLRPRGTPSPLVAFYSTPWSATEMAAEFRLPAGSRTGVGFVFGFVDARNHGRVSLDPAAGLIRLSRLADGSEVVLAERPTPIPTGEWLEIEVQVEEGVVEVNFQDDALEFSAPLGAEMPADSGFGFELPANSTADFRELTFGGVPATPRVSIVSCPAYEHGTATTDLLNGSSARFHPGAGISLAERTPAGGSAGSHSEFEWALVVRRYADGPVSNEEGDRFELRMVDAKGNALPGQPPNPVLTLSIPPGHLGGTFVETPGRIGPWRASTGDLYFIMEPAETDNVFMMIKSSDDGRTWREVDGANRPRTDDLESVDSRLVGDTIHIVHQVTPSVRYHAFRTADHPTHPDTWAVRDELVAAVDSIAQAATLVVRSDNSMAAFYVADTVNFNVRSASGTWGSNSVMDPGLAPASAGPKAVLGANDTVHLAYYGMDGTIWYRSLLRDGTLTAGQQLSSELDTTRAEFGAVLPLVFNPRTNTVVIVYRQSDGRLWERRVTNEGAPSEAVPVTDRAVVQEAVDSQQPEADAVLDGDTIWVLFVDEQTRGIFSTHDRGGWGPAQLQVDNILGSWVRGNIYSRRDGTKVYGYVYDAGSGGGAGMNRYGERVLNRR